MIVQTLDITELGQTAKAPMAQAELRRRAHGTSAPTPDQALVAVLDRVHGVRSLCVGSRVTHLHSGATCTDGLLNHFAGAGGPALLLKTIRIDAAAPTCRMTVAGVRRLLAATQELEALVLTRWWRGLRGGVRTPRLDAAVLVQTLADSCASLRVLTLGAILMTPGQLVRLGSLLPSLESLSLSGTCIAAAGVDAADATAGATEHARDQTNHEASFGCLTSLDIGNLAGVPLHAAAAVLALASELRAIRCSGAVGSAGGAQLMARHCQKLRKLELERAGSGSTALTAAALRAVMIRCIHLTELRLHDDAVERLEPIVGLHTIWGSAGRPALAITIIDITAHAISGSLVVAIAHSCPGLTDLALVLCSVALDEANEPSPASMRALAERCPKLRAVRTHSVRAADNSWLASIVVLCPELRCIIVEWDYAGQPAALGIELDHRWITALPRGRSFPNLQHIPAICGGFSWQDALLSVVWPLSERFCSLASLELRSADGCLDDGLVEHLADHFPLLERLVIDLDHLEDLDQFGKSAVSESGIWYLAHRCPRLCELRVPLANRVFGLCERIKALLPCMRELSLSPVND